jgi:hypothetical protein
MIWSVQNTEQIQAVGEIEHSRSERVIAIVCGAMVEQRLEIALKFRLHCHDHTQKQLFKPSGSLGPFKNKIDLGFLLYMYEKPLWLALTGICEIRNKFAHRLDQTFHGGDDQFKASLKHLILHEGVKFYPNPFMWSDTEERLRKPKNNREVFVTNVKLALVALMRDMLLHHPQSNESIIPKVPDGPISLPILPGGSSYLVQRRPARRRRPPHS